VLSFMALALAFTWSMWILYGAGLAPVELVLVGEYGPSAAAFALVARENGAEGVRDLLRRIGMWRVDARWYAFVLLVTPCLMLATAGVSAATGAALPELAELAEWPAHFRERTAAFAPSLGLLSGLSAFMAQGTWATLIGMIALGVSQGGLSEEPGLRGFLLPRARERFSLLTSALIVGVFWSVWHMFLPDHWKLLFESGPLPFLQTGLQNCAEYLLVCPPLAVLYAWVHANTNGSVLLAILLHAAYNISVTVVRSGWPDFPMLTFLALTWLLAIALVVLARRQFLRPAVSGTAMRSTGA